MFFLILFWCQAQEIQQKKLSNNIDVYVQHIQSQKMLEIRVDYDLFPVMLQEAGMAHLVEHLMFHPSRNMQGRTFDQWIESFGGNSKAYTNLDTLSLTTQIPIEAWERTLFLERDRMFHLCVGDKIPALEEEINVVTQEYLSEQLIMDKRVDELLRRMIFGHSTMGLSVLGDMVDMAFLSQEQVCSYISGRLQSMPVRIIISGDIEPQKAIADVVKYFDQPRLPQLKPHSIAPAHHPPPQKRYWYNSSEKSLYFFWSTVSVTDPKSDLFDIAKTVLLSRDIGWLKHEKYHVRIWSEQTRQGGYWLLRIEGGDIEAMYTFVHRRFTELISFWGGVGKKELNRAYLIQRRVLLHHTHNFSAQTSFLAQCLHREMSPFCLEEKLNRYKEIQPRALKDLFKTLLSLEQAYILSLGPSLDQALSHSSSLHP